MKLGFLEGCEVGDGGWRPELMDMEKKNFAYVVDSPEERFISFDIDCAVGEARTAERIRHRLRFTSFDVLGAGFARLGFDSGTEKST
jgi:hypothetical protein